MTNTNQTSTSSLRLTAALISVTVSAVCLLAASYLFRDPGSLAGEILLDRHTTAFPYPFTIQNAMWVMFFIGCGELWVRFRESAQQMAEVGKHYLPEDESAMLRSQDLGPIYKNVRADGKKPSFLQRLIGRCILQFQSSRSVDQANSLLNSSLELLQHELDMHYSMLRYLVWFIPTLGFIGTVVGIAFALNYAAGVADPQDPTLLAEISKRLGVAFYTTLLALVQSAILVFGLHVAQDRDELSLNRSGQYCLDNLINRLYEK